MYKWMGLPAILALQIGQALAADVAVAPSRDAIAPMALRDALNLFSSRERLHVVYVSGLVDGVRTKGAPAGLAPSATLKKLLEDTGLEFHYLSKDTISITTASKPAKTQSDAAAQGRSDTRGDAGKTLETVEVTAKAEGLAAMRVPTELREIPQSVSVITQDTLQQQNAFDLAGAFNWATGISLQQNVRTNSTSAYSRGFAVGEIHIDGGAPMALGSSGTDIDDLSEYDRIEVLRGADGLFGGSGNPGATVNLVRKQPQAAAQASLAATLGSWDFYRLQLDATGPLAFDGALRGRLATSSTEQHYFYDGADNQKHKLYGVLAYDLGPSTALNLGGSVEQSNTTPGFGLPLYAAGADPHLPRSVGLVFPGNHVRTHTAEAFAQLEQRFGEDWKLKLGITRLNTPRDVVSVAGAGSAINPLTGLARTLPVLTASNILGRSISADATLTGGFDWRDRRQDIVVGMDYSRGRSSSTSKTQSIDPSDMNPWRFNPTAYTASSASPTYPVYLQPTDYTSKAIGVYAALRLRLWDGGSVILGGRDNYQRVVSNSGIRVDFGSGNVVSLRSSRSASVSAGVVTPYAGVVYDLSSRYSLYASYADIYLPRSKAITFTGEVFPAVQGVNVEAGLKAAWFDGLLNGSLAAFRIRQSNWVAYDSDHPSSVQHCCYLSGTNTSKGVEAELTGRLTPDWQWSAGYTFNVNRLYANIPVSISGGITPLTTFAPKHLLKLWTQYRLPGEGQRWSLGGGLTAQTHTYKTGSACAQPDPNPQSRTGCLVDYRPVRIVQGFYAVATLRAVYRIAPHWSAALNIDNLTDRRYYQTLGTLIGGNWYGTPRSLMLTLNGTL